MIQNFKFRESDLLGAFIIEPFVASDERGALIKDFSESIFEMNGISHKLSEIFYTVSKKGVIRAIHFQSVKQQAKLVRCISGKIYDIIVDLRPGSPTFGEWRGFYLSGENSIELYIPEYFGHGYLVIEPAVVSYKCSERFYSEYDDGIKWNDKDINIEWPLDLIDTKIIVSTKDEHLQSFQEYKEKNKKHYK